MSNKSFLNAPRYQHRAFNNQVLTNKTLQFLMCFPNRKKLIQFQIFRSNLETFKVHLCILLFQQNGEKLQKIVYQVETPEHLQVCKLFPRLLAVITETPKISYSRMNLFNFSSCSYQKKKGRFIQRNSDLDLGRLKLVCADCPWKK